MINTDVILVWMFFTASGILFFMEGWRGLLFKASGIWLALAILLVLIEQSGLIVFSNKVSARLIYGIASLGLIIYEWRKGYLSALIKRENGIVGQKSRLPFSRFITFGMMFIIFDLLVYISNFSLAGIGLIVIFMTLLKRYVFSGPDKQSVWMSFMMAILVSFFVRDSVLEIYRMRDAAMAPMLRDGDAIFVQRNFFKAQPGDVLVYLSRQSGERTFIHRLITRAGDRVNVENQKIVFESKPICNVDMGALKTTLPSQYWTINGELRVPLGMMFMAGDNLNATENGSVCGYAYEADIRGKVIGQMRPLINFRNLARE